MNCDRAQLVLSARMDGERVGTRHAEAALSHAEGCARCRAFVDRSAHIRSSVRIRAAEPVPDLVEPIMLAVARIRPAPAGRIRPHRPRHRRRMSLAPAAAAAIAGVVLGSVFVGGPWQRPTNRPIAAAAVVRNVRELAPTLDAFQGTYTIRELGFAPDVPERSFDMEVAFLSPQRFRLEVRDRTDYGTSSWTPTDLTYIENVSTTYASGPSGCPADLPPGVCPPTRTTVTRLSEFSAAAPLPADLILPVATFGSARGFDVLGRGRVGDRDAVRLQLSFARAAPLFPFLRLGGAWRPFFARDRVLLWLDADSWLPLRYVVFPSRSEERREWELRYGRPVELPDSPLLEIELLSMSEEEPAAAEFEIPGAAPQIEIPIEDVAARVGYTPVAPAAPGDLELVSIVLPTSSAAVTPRTLLVYADGLDYLRVGEHRGWTGPGPFGPVDPAAQQVALPDGGIAYYEPAGEGFGRRLSLHSASGDLYLETNLPRHRLLAIASSMPVEGRPLPDAWRHARSPARVEVERIGTDEALAIAGLPSSLPSSLPNGYVVASAERSSMGSRTVGVTFHLRQPEMDMAGEPLTLHVALRSKLPSPSSADQARVRIGEVAGRWTPGRSQLEWIERGTYLSLQGELGLVTLLGIAATVSEALA